MKKLYPLFVVLLLTSNGFGQKLHEVIETYENGNIKSITYHKKIRYRVEKVKFEKYYENGQKADEDTPLFPTLISNKETNDKLSKPRKYMQSLLKAHNRPHADLHSFRHTFNQSLLELGMEIEDRQKLLAHASTTTKYILILILN